MVSREDAYSSEDIRALDGANNKKDAHEIR